MKVKKSYVSIFFYIFEEIFFKHNFKKNVAKNRSIIFLKFVYENAFFLKNVFFFENRAYFLNLLSKKGEAGLIFFAPYSKKIGDHSDQIYTHAVAEPIEN